MKSFAWMERGRCVLDAIPTAVFFSDDPADRARAAAACGACEVTVECQRHLGMPVELGLLDHEPSEYGHELHRRRGEECEPCKQEARRVQRARRAAWKAGWDEERRRVERQKKVEERRRWRERQRKGRAA